MSQVFVKNTNKFPFPNEAIDARGALGLYARDRGYVAGNNRLLSRTSAFVARVSQTHCDSICDPQVEPYRLLWHQGRPNSRRSVESHSVLPTNVPLMTVAWFAVSRIRQGAEAGNWGYEGKTKVNLIGGVERLVGLRFTSLVIDQDVIKYPQVLGGICIVLRTFDNNTGYRYY